jgi:hypothetical protein
VIDGASFVDGNESGEIANRGSQPFSVSALAIFLGGTLNGKAAIWLAGGVELTTKRPPLFQLASRTGMSEFLGKK